MAMEHAMESTLHCTATPMYFFSSWFTFISTFSTGSTEYELIVCTWLIQISGTQSKMANLDIQQTVKNDGDATVKNDVDADDDHGYGGGPIIQ